jgi:hypothetical protein
MGANPLSSLDKMGKNQALRHQRQVPNTDAQTEIRETVFTRRIPALLGLDIKMN